MPCDGIRDVRLWDRCEKAYNVMATGQVDDKESDVICDFLVVSEDFRDLSRPVGFENVSLYDLARYMWTYHQRGVMNYIRMHFLQLVARTKAFNARRQRTRRETSDIAAVQENLDHVKDKLDRRRNKLKDLHRDQAARKAKGDLPGYVAESIEACTSEMVGLVAERDALIKDITARTGANDLCLRFMGAEDDAVRAYTSHNGIPMEMEYKDLQKLSSPDPNTGKAAVVSCPGSGVITKVTKDNRDHRKRRLKRAARDSVVNAAIETRELKRNQREMKRSGHVVDPAVIETPQVLPRKDIGGTKVSADAGSTVSSLSSGPVQRRLVPSDDESPDDAYEPNGVCSDGESEGDETKDEAILVQNFEPITVDEAKEMALEDALGQGEAEETDHVPKDVDPRNWTVIPPGASTNTVTSQVFEYDAMNKARGGKLTKAEKASYGGGDLTGLKQKLQESLKSVAGNPEDDATHQGDIRGMNHNSDGDALNVLAAAGNTKVKGGRKGLPRRWETDIENTRGLRSKKKSESGVLHLSGGGGKWNEVGRKEKGPDATYRELKRRTAASGEQLPDTSRAAVKRIVKGVMHDNKRVDRVTVEAIEAIRLCMEEFAIEMFQGTVLLAAHANRDTIYPKDMNLCLNLRNNDPRPSQNDEPEDPTNAMNDGEEGNVEGEN